MSQDTAVSVVMCTCNGERFLREQLSSIADQTVPPMELVVCDDVSTDQTLSMLRDFAESAPFPIRIQCNSERLGSTRNFQQGILLARGEFLALCDQDDLWKPDRLERLVKVFADDSIGGIFTDALLIDDTGRLLDGSLWSRGHLPPQQQQEFQRDPVGLLLKQDVATGATMIFRRAVRDLYEEIPLEWVHDGWLTWMMTLHADRVGRLELLTDCETIYRVHQGQQTGQAAQQAGSRTEPLMVRLTKARALGHEHHTAAARRLSMVLNHWLSHGPKDVNREQQDSVARRLRGGIALLEKRAALPASSFLRFIQVIKLMPRYLQYGRGISSAVRDVWA
jgi:Glycosyl transferase family 2